VVISPTYWRQLILLMVSLNLYHDEYDPSSLIILFVGSEIVKRIDSVYTSMTSYRILVYRPARSLICTHIEPDSLVFSFPRILIMRLVIASTIDMKIVDESNCSYIL
jgi:hypothetical protein